MYVLKEYKTLLNTRPPSEILIRRPRKNLFWKIEDPSCIAARTVLVSILTINGHLIEKPSLGRAGRSGAGCSESSLASTRPAGSA